MEDEKTPAGLARFGLKMMPELADTISENGGPNVADLDMEDDTVANNIGAAVAMARFTQTVLDDITPAQTWTARNGPENKGPQCEADRLLMCHAPLLLAALRHTLLVLTRVVVTGESDVDIPQELVVVLNAMSNLSTATEEASEGLDAEAADMLDQVLEAVSDCLNRTESRGAGIVPPNPFGQDVVGEA